MRIAYLLPNLHVTGGARVGVEIGGRLVERGHEFSILIPKGRHKIPSPKGVKIIECGFAVHNPLLAVVTGLLGMLTKIPPVDIIIASMPTHAILAQFIGRFRKIPAINYALNDDVNFFNDRSLLRNRILLTIYKSVAKYALKSKYLLVNSHWTAVQCVKEGGIKPFGIVHSGYDKSVFLPRNNQTENKPLRIVTIGRHPRWKGLADLIKALNLIDVKTTPFVLTIITQDNLDLSDAKFPFEIIKPANDIELVNVYHKGDISVHPSWFEGFGLPPLEAQACGLPVISTNSGGVREFLIDNINSLIVPPREPQTMSVAITNLLQDNVLRERLSTAGLESCVNFTWDKVADQFESTIKKIVNDFNL